MVIYEEFSSQSVSQPVSSVSWSQGAIHTFDPKESRQLRRSEVIAVDLERNFAVLSRGDRKVTDFWQRVPLRGSSTEKSKSC